MSLNLGDVTFGLGADTSGLDDAARKLANFASAVTRAATSVSEADRAWASAAVRREAAIQSAMTRTAAFISQAQQSSASQDEVSSSINRANKVLGDYTLQLSRTTVGTVENVRANAAYSNAMSLLSRQLQQVSNSAAQQQTLLMNAARGVAALAEQERAAAIAAENMANAQMSAGMKQAAAIERTTIAALNLRRAQEEQGTVLANWWTNFNKGTTAANSMAGSLRGLHTATVLAVGPLSRTGAIIGTLTKILETGVAKFALFSAGVAVVGVTFGRLTEAIVNASKANQQLLAALEIGSGSAAAANFEYKNLLDISQQLGVQFSASAKEFGSFSAAIENTGISMAQAEEIFKGVTADATAQQRSTEQTASAFAALAQIASKGIVQMQNLREITRALPGFLNEMAKSMGVTTLQLEQMIKNGQVLAKDALPAVGRQLVADYWNKALTQSDNLVNSYARLHNSLEQFLLSLGETLGTVTKATGTLSGLNSMVIFLTKNLNAIVSGLVAASAATAVAFGAPFIGRLIQAVFQMNLLRIATAAWGAVITFVSNLTLVGVIARLAQLAIAVLTAVGVFKFMNKALDDTAAKQQELKTITEQYIKSSTDMKTGIDAVTQSYIDQNKVQAEVAKQAVRTASIQLQAELAVQQAHKALPTSRFTGFIAGTDTTAITKTQKALDDAIKTYEDLLATLDQLNKIQEHSSTTSSDLSDAQKKMIQSISDANLKIREQKDLFAAYLEGPAAVRAAEAQNTISTAVNELGKSLTAAKVPVADVTRLMKEYGDALEAVAAIKPGNDIVDQIQKTQAKLADLKAGFGGFETELLQVRDLSSSALMQVQIALGDVGASVEQTAKDWSVLNHQVENFKKTTSTLNDVNRKLASMQDELKAALGGPDTFKAFNDMKSYNEELAKWKQTLSDMGVPAAQIDTIAVKFTDTAIAINKAKDQLEGLKTTGELVASALKDAFSAFGDTMVNVFKTGKFAASDLLTSLENVITGLMNAIVQEWLFIPLANAIGGMFSGGGGLLGMLGFGGGAAATAGVAGLGGLTGTPNPFGARRGAVISDGKVARFGRGGLLGQRTMFSTSGGAVLASEDNQKEAIMPLMRTSSGDLGVNVQGLGGTNVYVNIVNQTGGDAKVDTKQTSDGRGGVKLDVMITKVIAKDIKQGGDVFKAMGGAFAINPRTVARG